MRLVVATLAALTLATGPAVAIPLDLLIIDDGFVRLEQQYLDRKR